MPNAYTPGPWAADKFGLVTAGKNRLHIAQAMTTGMGKAADANAALIAAAPELLEALRTIVANASSVQMDPQWAVDVARAAINKAIGE